MSRLERIAQGLLRPINVYAVSLLGMLTFMWGLWVVNTWWVAFKPTSVFHKAAELAPEWAWGMWSTICGLIIILAVFRGAYKWVSFSLGFGIWHWGTISIMCWWGDWQNTSGVTYTWIAAWTLYAWLNVKINFLGDHHGDEF